MKKYIYYYLTYFYYYLGRLFFSPYRSIYFLFIYILILAFINWSVSDCMNTGFELPVIAEAKPVLSQQGLSLKRSIIEYAGDLEKLEMKLTAAEKTIAEQQKIIDDLNKTVIQQRVKYRSLEFEANETLDRALNCVSELQQGHDLDNYK